MPRLIVGGGTTASGARFDRLMARYSKAIEGQTVQQQIALLTILIGCGEKAVEAFHAADNPLDETFVEDLERIVERSRQELAVLIAARDADGS